MFEITNTSDGRPHRAKMHTCGLPGVRGGQWFWPRRYPHYRAQALRRVATDLANLLKDVTDEEDSIRLCIMTAIASMNDAAELLSPTLKPPKPPIRRMRV